MIQCITCATCVIVMELKFNEKKAIQIAARLLQQAGGVIDLLRLTKLLYLVDREALMRWGLSLTGDRYASMPKGMVLSQTYDLSKRKFLQPRLWDDYISAPDHSHNMALLAEPGIDELSEEDIDLIDEIHALYKKKSTKFLIDMVHHKLPEWIDVGKSSQIVDYETVLRKSGCEKVDAILAEMQDYAYFEQFSV